MARRRMISAELINDEEYNSLSIEAQLLFVRMLAVSDDCGIVPAAEYTLTTLTNPPDKIRKGLNRFVQEIVSAGLGTIVEYGGKRFFLFNKSSFNRIQSYIINKRVSSEYLKITAEEFDKIDWGTNKTVGIKNASISTGVRKHFAEMFGLPTGNVSESRVASCKCGILGKISNNGFGYITLTGLNFDHIVPHRFGGSNQIDNFQILCPECNQTKKYADIEKYKALLVEELNRESIDEQLPTISGANGIESRKQKVESKEQKDTFGEFKNVLLTATEAASLANKLGERRASQAIEILSAYKASNGKTYKSDFATFRTWVIGELEKRETNGKPISITTKVQKRPPLPELGKVNIWCEDCKMNHRANEMCPKGVKI